MDKLRNSETRNKTTLVFTLATAAVCWFMFMLSTQSSITTELWGKGFNVSEDRTRAPYLFQASGVLAYVLGDLHLYSIIRTAIEIDCGERVQLARALARALAH